MGGAGPFIDPGDEAFRVLPVQADGGPARRLDIGGGGDQATPDLMPAQPQQRIAGLGLVARRLQEGEILLAGDGVFRQCESLQRHHMLRPFGIEASRLMRRAAHQEFARRDTDHLGTFGTFCESAIFLVLAPQQDGGGQDRGDAEFHCTIKPCIERHEHSGRLRQLQGCPGGRRRLPRHRRGLRKSHPRARIVEMPLSDGGEGLLDVLQAPLGLTWIEEDTTDPLGARHSRALWPVGRRPHLCGGNGRGVGAAAPDPGRARSARHLHLRHRAVAGRRKGARRQTRPAGHRRQRHQ